MDSNDPKYRYNKRGTKGARVGQAVSDILSKDQPTYSVGEILDGFGAKFAQELEKAIENYGEKMTREYNEALEQASDRERDNYRESLESDWDDSDDRRDYLRNFYDDNSARFLGNEDVEDNTWHKDPDGDDQLFFSTSTGERYKVSGVFTSQKFQGESVPDIQFSDDQGRFSVTGAGNAFEVFSKVVPSVVAYLKRKDPNVVTFTAAEPSRRKLYDRLVKTVIGTDTNRFAIMEDRGNTRYYVVGKETLRDAIMAKIGKKALEPEEMQPLVNPEEVTPEVDPNWWDEKSWEEEQTSNKLKPHKLSPSRITRLSTNDNQEKSVSAYYTKDWVTM